MRMYTPAEWREYAKRTHTHRTPAPLDDATRLDSHPVYFSVRRPAPDEGSTILACSARDLHRYVREQLSWPRGRVGGGGLNPDS